MINSSHSRWVEPAKHRHHTEQPKGDLISSGSPSPTPESTTAPQEVDKDQQGQQASPPPAQNSGSNQAATKVGDGTPTPTDTLPANNHLHPLSSRNSRQTTLPLPLILHL